MGNWFVKSFDNYYKFIDDDSSMIILTSASLDESGSDMVISFNHLSESVPKYEDMRDSFLSSSYTGSSEPVPQIISESLWEEKKTELKSYIINS